MSRNKVPAHWMNAPNKAPRSVWFLRGVESFVEVSLEEFSRYGSSNIIIPINDLRLPDLIRSIVFVPKSSHIYFTTPENPRLIKAHYVPEPWQKGVAENNYFHKSSISSSERISQSDSYPAMDFNDEIIALSSTTNQLYVLTVNRGRTRTSDLWQVHRIQVDPDKGFDKTSRSSVAQIDLPPELLENQSVVSFSVGNYEDDIAFYISGFNDGHIYWGQFRPSEHIKPAIFLKEFWNSLPFKASISILSNYIGSRKFIHLLVVDPSNNKIFDIRHRKSNPIIIDITDKIKTGTIANPNAVSVVKINTSDFIMDINPLGQTLKFYLVSCQNKDQIWTISDLPDLQNKSIKIQRAKIEMQRKRLEIQKKALETQRKFDEAKKLSFEIRAKSSELQKISLLEEYHLLPLIGGGYRDIKEFDENLLAYNIGIVDTIVVVHNSCIIFGSKDNIGWRALLLPQMLRYFDDKWVGGPPSKVKRTFVTKQELENS